MLGVKMTSRPLVFLDLDQTLICSFYPVSISQAESALKRAESKPEGPVKEKLVSRAKIRLEQLRGAFVVDQDLMCITRQNVKSDIESICEFAEVHIFTAAGEEYAEAVINKTGLSFPKNEGRVYSLRDIGIDMRWVGERPWVLVDDTQAFPKIRILGDMNADFRVVQVDPLELGETCKPLSAYLSSIRYKLGLGRI
jgi:hypothetical protein